LSAHDAAADLEAPRLIDESSSGWTFGWRAFWSWARTWPHLAQTHCILLAQEAQVHRPSWVAAQRRSGGHDGTRGLMCAPTEPETLRALHNAHRTAHRPCRPCGAVACQGISASHLAHPSAHAASALRRAGVSTRKESTAQEALLSDQWIVHLRARLSYQEVYAGWAASMQSRGSSARWRASASRCHRLIITAA